MAVRHRDKLIWPAAPFISQMGPTDPNGRLSVQLTQVIQRQYKLVYTVTNDSMTHYLWMDPPTTGS